LTALAIAFARQAGDLAGRLQSWVGTQRESTLSHIDRIPGVAPMLEWLDRNLEISAAHVQAWLIEGSRTLFQQLASMRRGFHGRSRNRALLHGDALPAVLHHPRRRPIARLGAALVPLPPERREELADRLSSVTRAVVRGTVVTAIVQGFLCGIAFSVVGLPAPVVFGWSRPCCRSFPSAGRRSCGDRALSRSWRSSTTRRPGS
jgi:hypothetical protein